MTTKPRRLFAHFAALCAALLAFGSTPAMAADGCEGFGDFDYLCGPASAEDLVLIPDTDWIIASGFSGGASLFFIDAEQKTWANLYPGDAPRARQDMQNFGACPGSPDPTGFVAHGLNIRRTGDAAARLFVVGHGEREAIEVFDIDASGDAPVVTWIGCVLLPDEMAANSVASLADGSLLATIPLYTDIPISAAFAGEPTGAVYRWSPGDVGFVQVEGTEMPYANGIEVSADGNEFYIASSGLVKIMAFSNTNPARLLRSSETLAFIPDNLHWGSNGELLTAGLNIADLVCGDVPMTSEFSLESLTRCARPFTALAADPGTLRTRVLVDSPAHEQFSNVTTALQVDTVLWLGTFAGDRIAYIDLDRGTD